MAGQTHHDQFDWLVGNTSATNQEPDTKDEEILTNLGGNHNQGHFPHILEFDPASIHDDHLKLWQYGLWSFQTGGTKLERFLPKNQQTQRKSLNFENWINGGLRRFQKLEF